MMQDISDAIFAILTADKPRNGFTDPLSDVGSGSIHAWCDAIASQIFSNVGSTFYPNSVYRVLAAGNVAGFSIYGAMGGGIDDDGSEMGMYVVGALIAASVSSGAQSGTAGSGTSATSLVKPSGAGNWTAGDLVGKFLVVTSGGGASSNNNRPTIRPIKANTTTTITVDFVAGMDSSTHFAIDVPGTTITARSGGDQCVLVANNLAPIVLRHLKFTGSSLANLVRSVGNTKVVLEGCLFDATSLLSTVYSERDGTFVVRNCVLTNGTSVEVKYCSQLANIENVWENSAGGILVEKSAYGLVTKLDSVSAAGYALKAVELHSLDAEVVANASGGNAVVLDSVANFTAVGSNLLTGAGNTGYGLQIDRTGKYTLVGCTISGTVGDVLFLSNPCPWSWFTTYPGNVEQFAAQATAQAAAPPSTAKTYKLGQYVFAGAQVEFGGRVLQYGYNNVSSNLKSISATGTNYATAYPLEPPNSQNEAARSFAEVGGIGNDGTGTVAAGTGVILPSGCAIGGALVVVKNSGANTLTVYAPTPGTIDGAPSTTIAPGGVKIFFSLWRDGGLSFTVANP
jgi:hypothetical protein